MTRTTLLSCLAAIALGCRGAPVVPPPMEGETPASYQTWQASAPSPDQPATLTQVAYRPPRTRRVAKPPRPLTPLPVVPMPTNGCAADYQWLVGRLRQIDGRWSVRYAEGSDRFGGELELLRAGPMRGFAAGQTVRVEGELIDPEPFQVRPAYRVRSLQLVDGG